MPGGAGARGPGRVAVGIGPRRGAKGRECGTPGPPGPPDRGVNGRAWPGCCGRIGCPGRGPLVRESRVASGKGPRFPVGSGPRFPVGNGRAGATGLAGAPGRPGVAPGAEAAGRMAEGFVPDGAAGLGCAAGRTDAAGRAAAGAAGAPAGAGGRIGVATGAVVAGAAGLAAGGATSGTGARGFASAVAADASPSGTLRFFTCTAGT